MQAECVKGHKTRLRGGARLSSWVGQSASTAVQLSTELGLTVSCAGEGRKLRCVLAWARGSNCAHLALILRFLRSSCVAQLSLINHLSVDD